MQIGRPVTCKIAAELGDLRQPNFGRDSSLSLEHQLELPEPMNLSPDIKVHSHSPLAQEPEISECCSRMLIAGSFLSEPAQAPTFAGQPNA